MLGSHCKRLLHKKQLPFIANDRTTVDITNLENILDFLQKEKITHIINCAAYTQVDKAETEIQQAYLVNATGPLYLGIAARRFGAHVIHFSTDYVFDGKGHSPYTEEHSCSPVGAYGMSKLAGETKLLDELDQCCIIRTSWLFGLPGKNFVETMIRLMNEKKHLRIVSDQIGRPTYAEDLAEAAIKLIDKQGIYHFANSFETSWYQFAKEIYYQGKELGLIRQDCQIEAISTQEYPTPAKRPAYSTLNTEKIASTLGYQPRPWQEALKEYLIAYKHFQDTQQVS
jgi:dTDP-4-dehydrorhamnose reductase